MWLFKLDTFKVTDVARLLQVKFIYTALVARLLIFTWQLRHKVMAFMLANFIITCAGVCKEKENKLYSLLGQTQNSRWTIT